MTWGNMDEWAADAQQQASIKAAQVLVDQITEV